MEEKESKEEGNKEKAGGKTGKNALEWTVFGFGLLVTFFVIGCLVYLMINQKDSPPELEISYKIAASETMPNRLQVKVKNTGYSTAENVIVEAALIKNDSTIEAAELEFEFLPNFSEREGWVSFNHDPKNADSVSLRIVSFRKP